MQVPVLTGIAICICTDGIKEGVNERQHKNWEKKPHAGFNDEAPLPQQRKRGKP